MITLRERFAEAGLFIGMLPASDPKEMWNRVDAIETATREDATAYLLSEKREDPVTKEILARLDRQDRALVILAAFQSKDAAHAVRAALGMPQ